MDLSQQQTLDDNPKAIQQIHFNGNLDRNNGESIFSITEETK